MIFQPSFRIIIISLVRVIGIRARKKSFRYLFYNYVLHYYIPKIWMLVGKENSYRSLSQCSMNIMFIIIIYSCSMLHVTWVTIWSKFSGNHATHGLCDIGHIRGQYGKSPFMICGACFIVVIHFYILWNRS